MATSRVTPTVGVMQPQLPLGSPVPSVPHAISVSLPTFRDNVDYEESAPRVVNAMVSGYPRFFVALKVKELMAVCEKKYGKPTESCFIWPTRKVAERCREFLNRYYQPASTTSSPTNSQVRIVEFVIHAPTAEVKPDLKHIKVFATFFPKDAFSFGKQFWQHTGDIISSRKAEFCLRWLHLKAEEDRADAATESRTTSTGGAAARHPRLHRHYSSSVAHTNTSTNAATNTNTNTNHPSSSSPLSSSSSSPTLTQEGFATTTTTTTSATALDDEDAPVEGGEDGLDSRDYDVYVEERYGRNLDLSFAPKAKQAMRRRIAAQVAHHAAAAASAASANGQQTEYVTEEDVYMYPTGMSAIYNAHRIALSLHPTRKSVCFGFPYTDTLKVLQKFGPGCYFYGHGEDHDVDTLEQEVLAKTLDPETKEEDKILAVMCEFPSNPLLKSANLVRLNALADKYGFLIIIDETLGNFVNVRTLEYADIVVSSLSKIFSGDSNVMGGSLVLNPQRKHYAALKEAMGREYEDLMWQEDAIFMERNSRTFQSRIHRIDENTEALCDFLRSHPKVREVFYPKYITREIYDHHRVEGAGFGGLFSLVFHAEKGSEQFFDALPFYKGPSLGTNFTLACPYTILAHYNELDWAAGYGIERELIRVAVGLEDREVLFKGFQDALDAIQE
ncbi:hypothetical protein DFQ27_002881 [Actinomortierella ambigua]|uniref:cystathionine gamma-synthase n=1 Tax=Actinomortierella ambigua TaxID=1343610 RepID=A0A9P6QAR9_9FUNG|nr:hypothetical protein DFQ27_002881 [Actinomortierella ambigua]